MHKDLVFKSLRLTLGLFATLACSFGAMFVVGYSMYYLATVHVAYFLSLLGGILFGVVWVCMYIQEVDDHDHEKREKVN